MGYLKTIIERTHDIRKLLKIYDVCRGCNLQAINHTYFHTCRLPDKYTFEHYIISINNSTVIWHI